MKAIAFYHDPERIHKLAAAFMEGCRLRGIKCAMHESTKPKTAEQADIVFMYGLGPAKPTFDAYEGKALRLVADLGYFRELVARVPHPQRRLRIAINAKQPDAHLNLRPHQSDRFKAMGLDYEPVKQRGKPILICGHSPNFAKEIGKEYGQWETEIAEKIKKVTDRPIVIREKPKNPHIVIPGVTRCDEKKCVQSIRSSWAVVTKSGNVGADAILHGIPVYAESGPGHVYGMKSIKEIGEAQPMSSEARLSALSDLAYWHWSPDEIASGQLIDHLRNEGFVA